MCEAADIPSTFSLAIGQREAAQQISLEPIYDQRRLNLKRF